MKQCLIRILQQFKRQQIACIVLKGIPLNMQLYDTQGIRCSKDIDLLVSQESLIQAHQALMDMGFKLHSVLSPIEMSHISVPIYNQLKDLTYRAEGLEIELHWQTCIIPMFSIQYSAELVDDQMIMNTLVPVFKKELNFVYLVMHASTSHWKRMQMVVDIALFYQKYQLNVFWENVLVIAAQKNAMRCLYEAKLILADFGVKLLDVPIDCWSRWMANIHYNYVKYLWQDTKRWRASQSQLMRFMMVPNLSLKWSLFKTAMLYRQVCQQSLKRRPHLSHKKLFLISLLDLLSINKK